MALYYPQARVNLSAVFDGFGGPDKPMVVPDIPPQAFNCHLNSYKEADTWEVTFNSKFFPFAPELFRSAAVELYLFQCPDQVAPFLWNRPENLLVTGLVDNAILTQGTDGGKITLEGRDYTALLIDRPWDPAKSGHKGRVPVGEELGEVVQALVDEAVQAQKIGRTITVQVVDVANPTTGATSATVTKKKVTIKPPPKSSKKKRGIAVKSDSSYWDVIYKLVMSYGYICYIQGWNLIITKPHVLEATAARTVHRVAYGRNLSQLEMERRLSKEAVPQIRVRCYSDKERRTLEGRFPGDKEKVTTGVGTVKEEFRVMTVTDVQDEAVLKEIARNAYNSIARGEGRLRFKTKHLLDLADDQGVQRDLLRLRPGDPVAVFWDSFNKELMTNANLGPEVKVARLVELGYSREVAAVVAENFDKLNYFRQPFYTREINLVYSKEQGLELDVEARNFINASRDDKAA